MTTYPLSEFGGDGAGAPPYSMPDSGVPVLFVLLGSIGNASIVRLSIMFFIGSKF